MGNIDLASALEALEATCAKNRRLRAEFRSLAMHILAAVPTSPVAQSPLPPPPFQWFAAAMARREAANRQ